MQSDVQLAESVLKTHYWRRNRRFIIPERNWELPNHVRSALREKGLDITLLPLEFEKTVQRVTHVLRSRNAKKAAGTRQRNREFKKQFVLPL